MRTSTLVLSVLGLGACNSVAPDGQVADGQPGQEATPSNPSVAPAGPRPGVGHLQAMQATRSPLAPDDLHLGNLIVGLARMIGSTQHNFEVEEPSGIRSLYSGQDVGWKAAAARTVTAEAIGGFARVRVSAAVVARARASKQRTITLSLEDPQSQVEVLVHQGRQDFVFRAGDPWVSGVVQVVISDNGTALGLYRIVRHHPPAAANGAIGASYFETGIFEDAGLPTLKYWNSSTTQWPALPGGWLNGSLNASMRPGTER